MPGPRQVFLLLAELLVPIFFIINRRERALLAWICFTVSINVFDTHLFVNMPAARIAGLLLLPQAFTTLSGWMKTRPSKALVMQYGYLVFLGLVFGFLFPWSEGGLLRSFNQTAPGRTIIYLTRLGADISLAFFVARQVIRTKRPEIVVKYILVGTSVAVLAGVVGLATRTDMYGLITGLGSAKWDFRVRGLNYEPRGLGLIATHGMLLSLLVYSRHRSRKIFTLILLHAFALFVTVSTSALLAAAAGATSLFVFDKKARPLILVLAIVGALALAFLVSTESSWLMSWSYNMRLRLTTDRIESTAMNIVEDIAFRIGIFDGSALLFLVSNPLHLLVGTGPGLVSLPATWFLPRSVYYAWAWESGQGINTTPTSGFLLEISNAGLVGILLWLTFFASSLQALNHLRRQGGSEDEPWAIGRSAFVMAAAIYLAQASPLSAIWPVFMGTGLAAARLKLVYRESGVSVKPTFGVTKL